jgi:hypothetical protein
MPPAQTDRGGFVLGEPVVDRDDLDLGLGGEEPGEWVAGVQVTEHPAPAVKVDDDILAGRSRGQVAADRDVPAVVAGHVVGDSAVERHWRIGVQAGDEVPERGPLLVGGDTVVERNGLGVEFVEQRGDVRRQRGPHGRG